MKRQFYQKMRYNFIKIFFSFFIKLKKKDRTRRIPANKEIVF